MKTYAITKTGRKFPVTLNETTGRLTININGEEFGVRFRKYDGVPVVEIAYIKAKEKLATILGVPTPKARILLRVEKDLSQDIAKIEKNIKLREYKELLAKLPPFNPPKNTPNPEKYVELQKK